MFLSAALALILILLFMYLNSLPEMGGQQTNETGGWIPGMIIVFFTLEGTFSYVVFCYALLYLFRYGSPSIRLEAVSQMRESIFF